MTKLLSILRILFLLAFSSYGIAIARGLLNMPSAERLQSPVVAVALMVIAICFAIIIFLRFGSTHYKAYMVHRTLLEIEMNLTEMFARLKPRGVDKRRDRMVDIMKEAELCKHNPNASFVVVSNRDKGASQKTARSIIEADKSDLAGFRSKRSSARINAFAYEALIKGQFKTARSHILEKHMEALAKGKETPVVLNGLKRLLKLPTNLSAEQIQQELDKDSPLGVFPASIHLAIKYWRHPRSLVFRNENVEATGKEALQAMRLF